jgi:Fe-S cluster assembly protein SufD
MSTTHLSHQAAGTGVRPEALYLDEVDRLLADRGDEPASLVELRRHARERFEATGFPSPRSERWRLSTLKPVLDGTYRTSRLDDSAGSDSSAKPDRCAISGLLLDRWRPRTSSRLVFLDGHLHPELSDTGRLPRGTVVTSLVQGHAEHSELIAATLGRHARVDDEPFVALNTSALSDGAFIYLAPGAVLDQPVQVVWISSPGGSAVVAYPRTLVVAGAQAQGSIVECYLGTEGVSLSCPVTELVLGEGAVLDQVRIQEESRKAHHVGTQQASLEGDSRLRSRVVSLGGATSRLDLGVELGGRGAHAELDGLYLADASQRTDHFLTVRHAQPDATSSQLYRGILDGAARAVFTGRIVVEPDAQRTDARQSNRNLLLSERAHVHSNPQLEIFADDVRCTHGSTVGRLDEEAIFYLRSRGIPRSAAESLLTYAFAGDLVGRIPVPEIRERLESILLERLPEGGLVREAV